MFLETILGQINEATPTLLLTAGLVIGLSHAFEPDHVAAMLTQLKTKNKEERKTIQKIKSSALRNSLLGALWGLGHTSMILMMSILVFLFSWNLPSQIFDGFELIVGLMLMVLGISVFMNKKIIRLRHSHPHIHNDGFIHAHPHDHNDKSHSHGHRSYLIGCIHGLAGSGGLIALSVSSLTEIHTVFSFVIIFGIGSIIGMLLISGAMSLPLILLNNLNKLKNFVQITTGVISVTIGVDVIIGISFIENVFGLT